MLAVSGCETESGCVNMKSMCRRMRDGGVRMCWCESCVEFCNESGGRSGGWCLGNGDTDVACGHVARVTARPMVRWVR